MTRADNHFTLMDTSNISAPLWSEHNLTGRDCVEISDVLTHQGVQELITRKASIDGNNEWVSSSTPPSPTQQSNSARFMWIPSKLGNRKTQLDVTKTLLDRAVKDYHLGEAFTYYRETYSGAFECPSGLANSDTARSYCFSYHPKVALIWRVRTNGDTTSAIVLATEPQIETFKKALKSCCSPSYNMHPMFPAYVTAHALSVEVDELHSELKSLINSVEVRTQHHRFKNRPEPPAEGSLGSLSALMSGCETKLAAITRKLKVVEDLLEFIGHRCQPTSLASNIQGSTVNPHCADSILSQKVADRRRRIKLQMIDNEYTVERARIQRSAIFSMIAQDDASVGIEVAHESMIIAIHAKRDSAAMRTLAVVTMIFLPGTFVASLFSMPLLDWEGAAGGGVLRPKFKFYWAVTLPLTIVTLIIYAFWSAWYCNRNEACVWKDVESLRAKRRC